MKIFSVFIIGLVLGISVVYFGGETAVQRVQNLHTENSMKTLANTYEFQMKTIEMLEAGNTEMALDRLRNMVAVEKSILEKCIAGNCAPGITDELQTKIKP